MTLIIGIVDITRVLYGNTEYWILNEYCYQYCMYNLVIGGAVAHSFAPKDPQQELPFAVFLVNIFSLPGFLPILLLRTILARTELTLPASHLLTHEHNHTISFFWAECLYHCPPGTWVHLGSTPCKTPGIIYETDIHCAQQLSSLHHAHYWGSSTAAKSTIIDNIY